MIAELLLAYKAVKEQKAREASLKRFMGKNPDYAIIKALVLEARTDVVATIHFPNGTTLDIKKRDAFDKLTDQMDPDLKAAY